MMPPYIKSSRTCLKTCETVIARMYGTHFAVMLTGKDDMVFGVLVEARFRFVGIFPAKGDRHQDLTWLTCIFIF